MGERDSEGGTPGAENEAPQPPQTRRVDRNGMGGGILLPADWVPGKHYELGVRGSARPRK